MVAPLMPGFLPRHALIPLIVACALFMENLDSTVLSTALPAIAVSLGENPVRLNLAITSYLFSLAVFIPISGWVADRFGARRVFRAAILVFTLGSVLCGISQSLPELVLARIFQGLGGAMMVPVGRLVLLRSVAKSDLVSAMTYLTVPALIGPVIGPPLGGFITTYLSWRWVFFINLPIGLLGMVLATLFIGDIREERPPPLDVAGFLLTGIGLMCIVVGFESLGRGILAPGAVLGLFALGAVSLAVYVHHFRRQRHPALDLSLLRIQTFRTSIIGGFMFRIGIGAVPFLLPLMLQLGFGMTPFHSGLLTFAGAAGALLMKTTAGPILRRVGFRRVLLFNAILSGAILASYGLFRPDTPGWVILALLLVGGYFRSLQFTSVNALAYADIARQRMSQATSFASMSQQLSLSVGVGTGALLLHLTVAAHGGGSIGAADFLPAFLVVGLIAGISCLVHLPLAPDAGAEVSGQRRREPAVDRLAIEPDGE
jgi:EmrB/QacA subfamily drug resistance transporter